MTREARVCQCCLKRVLKGGQQHVSQQKPGAGEQGDAIRPTGEPAGDVSELPVLLAERRDDGLACRPQASSIRDRVQDYWRLGVSEPRNSSRNSREKFRKTLLTVSM